MHMVLSRPTEDAAFAPEEADEACVAQWSGQAQSQLSAAFAALEVPHDWDEPAEASVAVLRAARDQLNDDMRRLAQSGLGTRLTRIHGDLHLGQVLVANGDVFIIDFEGEPAKPLQQRRAKNSRLRDVAGMVRSFDYAAAVVERKSRESHPHLAEDHRRAFLESFVRNATDAFLGGYQEAMGINDPDSERDLLNLFLLEKAAYEVAYEAANRPTWIDVPVRGLAKLTQMLTAAETL
jgi:maltose alpha-D-glucosyltransferase/alpha-amylase